MIHVCPRCRECGDEYKSCRCDCCVCDSCREKYINPILLIIANNAEEYDVPWYDMIDILPIYQTFDSIGWRILSQNKHHDMNVLTLPGQDRDGLEWIDDEFIDNFPVYIDTYSYVINDDNIIIFAKLKNGYWFIYNAKDIHDNNFSQNGIITIYAGKNREIVKQNALTADDLARFNEKYYNI